MTKRYDSPTIRIGVYECSEDITTSAVMDDGTIDNRDDHTEDMSGYIP